MAARFSCLPPVDSDRMPFAELLRTAMYFGLGKAPPRNHILTRWQEKALSEALESEHATRFGRQKESKPKDNTLHKWLGGGTVPNDENLSVLIAVLTDRGGIEHADQWRNAFQKSAVMSRRKESRQSEVGTDAPKGIYPRGQVSTSSARSLVAVLSELFPTYGTEHLRAHLSADHASDLFEISNQRRLPSDATAEQALHLLLHQGVMAALFECSIASFLAQEPVSLPFDQTHSAELSHIIATNSEPFTIWDFKGLAQHPLLNMVIGRHDTLSDQLLEDAIFREFVRNQGFYTQSLTPLWTGVRDETPFLAWLQLRLHRAAIDLEMRRSLLSTSRGGTGEALSLRDIYVSLPCISMQQWEESQREIDDVTEFFHSETLFRSFLERNWRSDDAADRVLVLRGDPGAGKTSVLKALAWSASQSKDTAVLFVSFQKGVEFADDAELRLRSRSLQGFAQHSDSINILHFVQLAGFSRLVIFFDGLDELGSVSAHERQVRLFSEVIARMLDASCPLPCKFVISGRDQAFRPTEFELNLDEASYRLVGLVQERIEPQKPDAYIEEENISYFFDLRMQWLEKFCQYKSLHGNLVTAPQVMTSLRGLDSLSAEPLLLFLLARLVFVVANRHKGVGFDLSAVFDISRPSGLTKSDIYSLLIASIRHPQHRDPSKIDRPFREGGLPEGKNFERVLGCMAVPTWHNGTGRRGTLKAFFEQAEQQGILLQARRFTTAAEEGDASLVDPDHLSLMSVFYFDVWDGSDDDGQEYEFTHKSFTSYLLAREIFSAAIQLAFVFQENSKAGQGAALENWARLTCFGYEEPEILRFLMLEVDRYFHPEGGKFLQDLGMIGETAQDIRRRDVLVDTDDFRAPFMALEDGGHILLARLAAQIELPRLDVAYQRCLVMLFAVWTAFARGTQRSAHDSYTLELPEQDRVFRTLAAPIDANELEALYNPRAETSYFSESLSSLNLESCDLSGLNLINGRIWNSNLKHAHVQLSALDWASIEECSADGLAFICCQLNHARFFRTNAFSLVNSVMRHGLIEHCRFTGILFGKSELTATKLKNCRFENCTFEAISFEEAQIENCSFFGCNFSMCVFDNASISEVRFNECQFQICTAEDVEVAQSVHFDKESGFPFPE